MSRSTGQLTGDVTWRQRSSSWPQNTWGLVSP